MAQSHPDYFRVIKTEIWTLRGPDAERFLNGLSTMHVSRSAPQGEKLCGRGLFLDPKGKLLAPLVFVRDSSESVRLRLDVGCHTRGNTVTELNQSLYDHLSAIIIADDVVIERSPAQVTIAWSAKLAQTVSSEPLPPWRPNADDKVYVLGAANGLEVIPLPHLGPHAFELWADADALAPVVSGVEISEDQLRDIYFAARYLEFPEALRVGDLPLEFALYDAISFFKGCYRGQETIARATYRGKLVKGLCEMSFATTLDVNDNQLVSPEGQIVGELRYLSTDRRRALGLLRFDVSDVRTATFGVAVTGVTRLVQEHNERFR